MNIISMVNGKGGVGKTASSTNLATGLALEGKRVLIVDLDKQGNTSNHFKAYNPELPSVADVIFNDMNPAQAIQTTEVENLHVMPSKYNDMEGANSKIILDINRSREHRLVPLQTLDYDYIIIDCPPDLEILTVNALAISNYVMVPMKAEKWSLEGLDKITAKINSVRDQFNSKLKLMGVFVTMDDNSAVSKDVIKQFSEVFKGKFFKTTIRYSKLFSRSTFSMSPVVLSYPKSNVSMDYLKLTKEVLNYAE